MGCGCLAVLVSLFAPRFVLFFMWVFGFERLQQAMDSFIMGLLGFLFVPYATVFYVLVYDPLTGVSTFGWLIVGIGLLLDLSSYFGGERGRRQRYAAA